MNMGRLRCRIHGHAWNNTSEIISPSKSDPFYIVHVSCIRCGKTKVLESRTGTLPNRNKT